ncbi:MAG: putative porin [Candidatus Omnitrophota bacterium]
MMKKGIIICLLALFSAASCSYASDMDILVQKLVDKGVLTPGEGQQILTETKEEIRKEMAQGKVAGVPQWVQDIKLKGDFRLRYQWDKAKQAASTDSQRDRARIRLRIGAETRVVDNFNVGFGIATGTTSDPKSTNITLGDGFAAKNIVLDYAYGRYTPDWNSPVSTTFVGGRFKNPFWEPISALVDGDINLDGVSTTLGYKVNDSADLFLSYGFLTVLENSSDRGDPILNVIQPGVNWKILDNVKLKSAVDFWLANGVKDHTAISYSPGSNSMGRLSDQNKQSSSVVYLHDYKSVVPKLEIGFTEPFFGFNTGFPYFGVFGEYINNLDPSEKKTGWIAGLKIGNEKVSGKNQWQFVYDYRFIEKDAFLDIFPDSDFYGGKTNAKGNHLSFNYGVSKNSVLTLSYFNTRNMTRLTNKSDSSRLPAQTIQADWTVKF